MTSAPPAQGAPSKWLLGALLGLSALAFMTGLSDAPIERAEIYFLDAARAMVETSDWLVPRYRGEPFYDKPPLTYWLLASSFEFFGPSLFAGRLMAVLLAMATLGATYFFSTRLVALRGPGQASADGHRAAFMAAAILASSYAFVSFARLTMSDMVLTLLTLLAGGAYLTFEAGAKAGWLVGCGAWLGLGFLTKGPIAWVYFGGLLIAHGVVERRVPRIFNRAGLMGTLTAVVLAASWFVCVYVQEGGEPLRWFFLRENLQRFAAQTYDTDQPFWYYGLTYAIEGLPWSVLAFPAALFAFRARSPRVLRVIFLWTLLMLVPLSLSKGKIDYYLLPLLPPLSIATGAYLSIGAPSPRTLRLFAGLAAALLLEATKAPMLPPPWAPSAGEVQWLHVFLAACALACLAAALRPRPVTIVSVAAASVLGTAVLLFGVLVPAYRSAQPTETLLDDIARERAFNPDLRVAACNDPLRLQRDLLFSFRLPVLESCELWAVAAASKKFLILATPAEEAALRKGEGIRHIATADLLPADVTRIGTLLMGPTASTVGLLANFQTADPVARRKRNREFKRWLDTEEGRPQREIEERRVEEEERRARLSKK